MNRFFKIFLKLIIGLVILFIVVALTFYWFISTRWKKYYTEKEIKEYVAIIENTPKFSKSLYSIYDKLYNNDRHKSITRIYLSIIWNELILNRYHENHCWFVVAAQDFARLKAQKIIRYQEFILAWGLEKYTTSEKCFDYSLYSQNKEFIDDFRSFNIPNITDLNDTTEILKYILITKAPTRFTRNPDLLKLRTEELRNKLDEK